MPPEDVAGAAGREDGRPFRHHMVSPSALVMTVGTPLSSTDAPLLRRQRARRFEPICEHGRRRRVPTSRANSSGMWREQRVAVADQARKTSEIAGEGVERVGIEHDRAG